MISIVVGVSSFGVSPANLNYRMEGVVVKGIVEDICSDKVKLYFNRGKSKRLRLYLFLSRPFSFIEC